MKKNVLAGIAGTLTIGSVVAAQPPGGQSTPLASFASPITASTPLWQTLTEGMTFEEAASALRAINGVAAVTIKTKKQKPVSLEIEYTTTSEGVPIGPMNATISTTFEHGQLATLSLTNDDCASVVRARQSAIDGALKAKYGNYVKAKVVDDKGVLSGYQHHFWNAQTRVIVGWRLHNNAADDLAAVGKSGSGTLGKIADDIVLADAKSELDKCPIDRGERLETTLSYESQERFLAEDSAFKSKQAVDAQNTKNAL